MANAKPPPGLQIAQILADLSDLNVAEPPAALALVTAHLNVFPNTKRTQRNSKTSLSRSSTSTSISASASASAQNQRGGSSGVTSPTLLQTLSRNDSSGLGAEGASSRYRTASPGAELDPDLERANVLMQLYESRGRLKQQESGGLARARANVETVAEKYSKKKDGLGH